MATFTQIDRAKAWLDKTGLKQTNQPLYQIILVLIDTLRQAQNEINVVAASGGGTGGGGITSLSGDVVATGPGAATATIQPNVVSYGKIQQVSDGQRLLGREAAVGNVEEIELGADLEITGGKLEIIPGGGGTGGGIAHNLLSTTHPDTLPASPQLGDLIRAVEDTEFEGVYYGGFLLAPVVEDFSGIIAGYDQTFGLVAPISAGYMPPAIAFIPTPQPDNFLAWDIIDAFLQAPVVEDFEGIRGAINALVPGGTERGPGNSGGYDTYPVEIIPTPDPSHLSGGNLWSRIGIGSEDQVLTVVDGLPEWADLPAPPASLTFPWEDIPFDAGDFTASGGTTPTWTVPTPTRWQVQYFPQSNSPIQYNVRVAFYVEASTVGGSGPTQLIIQLPFTLLGEFAQFISIQENGGATTDTYIQYNASVDGSLLTVQKVGGGAFDTTAGETYIAFEISGTLQA